MLERFSSIDWNDLPVFLALFRARSLRGAARAMGLNHATVNRRLKQLETSLGARLFDRTPDGFLLTQAGEVMLRSAERVEGEVFGAERAIAGRDSAPEGQVKVSMPYAVMRAFLAPDITGFSEKFPGIDLEIELTDEFSDLARREADVSIRMAFDIMDNVVCRRLVRYSKAIYATRELIDALGTAGGEQSQKVNWIGWGDEYVSHEWIRDTPFPRLPVRHILSGHAAQLEAARAGLGLTMLPCFLADNERGIERVPGCEVIPDRSIWLVMHNDLRKSARIRAFADFIVPAILNHRTALEGDRAGQTSAST